jgi:2-desacetyl-2-hydroxyethyl bacteriochlorophyllide A dehydrogenase
VGLCGTDYHIYQGKHPFLEYPRVLGHELAVELVEAPAQSDLTLGATYVVNPYVSCGHCIACRNGKRNCCANIAVLGVHRDGGMTPLLATPEQNLVRADGLTADQCATVEFLAIGAHAVGRGAPRRGERVLVAGAGPIGLGVGLFAKSTGATVTLADVNAERLEVAQRLAGTGAALISDSDNGADQVAALLEQHTDGEGFDVVFDATGSARAMERGFDFAAPGGRYVLVSVVRDTLRFSDPDFHRKELTLLGSRNALPVDFETVIAAIRDGKVPVERMITHRTTLEDAAADIPRWATQKQGLVKAVITLDSQP